MGGVSSEHDVSINSGRMVAGSLDPDRYEVTAVTITQDGRWSFAGSEPLHIAEAVRQLYGLGVDCVFIALHGPFGEDGRIQGLLDLLDIPYTSSGCTASGVTMDKVLCKAVVRQLGIRLAEHAIVRRDEWDADPDGVTQRIQSTLGFSCVLKSPCQGSSLGMAISSTVADFKHDMDRVLHFGDLVMIEEFLPGNEVTCGVLDLGQGEPARALPVTQILPVSSSYFDYEAKYTPGATEEITPAEISAELTAKVQRIAVQVHEITGCRIWSRSDFIVVGNEPVWIEVNTIPGMTQTSLYPQAAKAAGISYGKLVELFVESAIARHAKHW
jgi:D-alanine-D-alanine ligase